MDKRRIRGTYEESNVMSDYSFIMSNFQRLPVRPVHADGISTPLSNMLFRTDLAACQARADYIPLVFRNE